MNTTLLSAKQYATSVGVKKNAILARIKNGTLDKNVTAIKVDSTWIMQVPTK